mmetsp:Transcript_8057/g.22389  ORF Transcript_8057/g.22389 Transcript_8057/m.22389 type:complete len:219 (-) Transcript_8057:532-1188(-)
MALLYWCTANPPGPLETPHCTHTSSSSIPDSSLTTTRMPRTPRSSTSFETSSSPPKKSADSSIVSYFRSTRPSRRHPSLWAFTRNNLRLSFAGHLARLVSSTASLSSTVSSRSRSSNAHPGIRSRRSRAHTHRRNCALSSPPQPQNPLGYPFVCTNPRSSYTVTPPKHPSASYLHPPASSTLTKPLPPDFIILLSADVAFSSPLSSCSVSCSVTPARR